MKAATNYTETNEVAVFQQNFIYKIGSDRIWPAGYSPPTSDFEDYMR